MKSYSQKRLVGGGVVAGHLRKVVSDFSRRGAAGRERAECQRAVVLRSGRVFCSRRCGRLKSWTTFAGELFRLVGFFLARRLGDREEGGGEALVEGEEVLDPGAVGGERVAAFEGGGACATLQWKKSIQNRCFCIP